jgi:dihydroceramidase|eukprot:g7682.t1
MGYWGKVTSDYDFCERNYVVTYYVAEFFSSLSSVPILLFGLYFLKHAIVHKLGWKIMLSSIGVAIIGLGSLAFHGTLKREGQMLDELPMLWSSLFFLFTVLTLGAKAESTRWWGCVLAACGIVSTTIYFAGGFVIFIISYIVTVASVIICTVKYASESRHADLKRFANLAVVLYAGGFFLLWIPEQVFCGNRLLPDRPITGLTDLPVPLHAFFHWTSAIGPYYWLAFAAYGHLAERRSSVRVYYPRHWMSLGLALPVVHEHAPKEM